MTPRDARRRSGPDSPRVLKVDEATRAELQRLRAHGTRRVVLRVDIVEMRALGVGVLEIARLLDVSSDTVRLWCDRFLAGGVGALVDRARSGRRKDM